MLTGEAVSQRKISGEKRRKSSIDAAYNHMRCPTYGGWIDFSDPAA